MVAKSIEAYLHIPYTIEVLRDDDEENPGWVARVVELPGCLTQGDTFEELGEMIQDAMRAWFEVALERGLPIPEPREGQEYSGKFVVRVPKSLHRRLVEAAGREGVSLNQYINVQLAGSALPSKDHESKVSSSVDWPGLSKAVMGALRRAGLSEEAGQLDERLFAEWVSAQVALAEDALSRGANRDALYELENLILVMGQYHEHSPVMSAMVQMLEFQCNLVEQSLRVQQSVVQQASQISELIQKTYQSALPKMDRTADMRNRLGRLKKETQDQFDVTSEYKGLLPRRRDE